MFKDTIEYIDYNGDNCTETLYFNLTKTDLIKLQNSFVGGFESKFNKLTNLLADAEVNEAAKDLVVPELLSFFETIIRYSYGIKSEDGKRFTKNSQATEDFINSEAYSVVFMKFASDLDYVNSFMIGIMPNDIAEEIKQDVALQSSNVHKLEDIKEQ